LKKGLFKAILPLPAITDAGSQFVYEYLHEFEAKTGKDLTLILAAWLQL
jgi:hypothetical protein